MNRMSVVRTCCLSLGAWVLILALSSCGPGETGDPSDTATVVDEPILAAPAEPETDIGDVEQAITIVGRLSGLSASDTIRENTVSDTRKRIRSVTIDVAPPNPEKLWLALQVHSMRGFEDRPVILDVRVKVEERLMETFTMFLGPDAPDNNFQSDVDVLFGLDTIPETMLVTMEADALLLPKGIDLTKVDPYTVSEGDRTKSITFTPVRINFASPGPKPTGETPDDASAPTAPPESETPTPAETPGAIE